MELTSTPEVCPLGYTIGGNGMSIPWDSAIDNGKWDEIKDTCVAINMRTLIRNAVDSYTKESGIKESVADRVREDILLLKEYFRDMHNSTIWVYCINYKRLGLNKLPNWRTPTTDRQKELDDIYDYAIKELMPSIDKWHDRKVAFVGHYIVTHIAYDLIDLPKHVKLIESHTGAIKNREQFTTKLNLNNAEYMTVPFNRDTYFIYGDKVLLNRNRRVTKSIIDILLASKVTPLTTESRFDMVLRMNDPLLHKFLRGI